MRMWMWIVTRLLEGSVAASLLVVAIIVAAFLVLGNTALLLVACSSCTP
jgi:hypothetical protein